MARCRPGGKWRRGQKEGTPYQRDQTLQMSSCAGQVGGVARSAAQDCPPLGGPPSAARGHGQSPPTSSLPSADICWAAVGTCPEGVSLDPALPWACCAPLGKLLDLSEPPCLHL